MHKKGYVRTLKSYDNEDPRTEYTISSRKLMQDMMAIKGGVRGSIMEEISSRKIERRGVMSRVAELDKEIESLREEVKRLKKKIQKEKKPPKKEKKPKRASSAPPPALEEPAFLAAEIGVGYKSKGPIGFGGRDWAPPAVPWQQVRVLHPTLDALKKQYYSIMPRIILPPRNVTKKAVERKTTKTAYRESISLPPPDAEKMTAFNYDSLPLHSNMFSKTNTAPKELVKKSTIISENNHLLPAMCRWLFFCFHKSGHKDVPRTLYIRRNKDGSYNIHTYCMALQQDEEFRRGFDNGTMKNPYVHTFVYLLTLYAITMPVWEGDQEDTMQTLRYERVCGSNFVCPMPELILKDGELFAYFVKGMESSSRRQKEKLRSLENVKKLYTPKSIGRLPARIHKGGGVLKMGRDRECADLLCRTLFMAHSGLPVTGTFYTWYTHPYERLAVIYLYTLKNLWAATLAGCSDDFRSVWKYENRDSLFKKSVDLWDTVITLIMDGIAANKAVPEDTSLFKVSFDLKTVLGHPGELKARVWATDFGTPVAPLDPYVAEYTWEVDVNLVLAKARQKHGTQFAQQKA
eukprot:TRINITY_DN14611_c0_g2_i6.p1 TRINITY_DN14611_c0_g2~~TRINITY_DN14611_c0_g2_i6.p1  ORF type:complete len:574 (+),score=189.02 TRINITY_DN14611_c0_g2_i6:172-1893(+)